MSQNDRIIAFTEQNGSISGKEAMDELGCMRLPARIAEIRERGYTITKAMEDGVNRFGEKIRYARYWIKKGV